MKSVELVHNIEYSRTIVPSSMRSPYWKYFGFPSDSANNILTKQKIICTLCNTVIAYNKNTSNLRTHLVAKHCELLQEMHHQQNKTQSAEVQQQQQQQKRARRQQLMDEGTAIEGDDDWTVVEYMEKRIRNDNAIKGECISTNKKRQTLIATDVVEDDDGDVVEIVDHAIDEISADGDDIELAAYAAATDLHAGSIDGQIMRATNAIESNSAHSYELLLDDGIDCPKNDAAVPSAVDVDMDTVVGMLITDLLPASIVDGAGFRRLFNPFNNFNRMSIELKVNSMYDTMSENIRKHLKKICETQTYSFSFEIYKNVDDLSIISVYINYYRSVGNQLQSVLYHNYLLEDIQDAAKYANFEAITSQLNLGKSAAIVLSETNSIVEEFFGSYGIPNIICLESVLRQCLLRVFDLSWVKDEFKTVSEIATDFVKGDNTLITPEVYPQCPWSKLNFMQFCNDNISICSADNSSVFDNIKELINYLSPLKTVLDTISDDPLAICSLMLPFTIRLLEERTSTFFPEEYSTEVKDIISEELTKRILNNSFLNEATFFDARFRSNFVNAETFDKIKSAVCQRFKTLEESDVKPAIQKTDAVEDKCSNKRKSSLKSFFQRNAEMNQESRVQRKPSSIENELNRCNCEQALDLEQCPIKWWHENGAAYKQLKPIAAYYMIVPCCVNRLFRYGAGERNELKHKRFMLRNENDLKLWYLHYNQSYYDELIMTEQQT